MRSHLLKYGVAPLTLLYVLALFGFGITVGLAYVSLGGSAASSANVVGPVAVAAVVGVSIYAIVRRRRAVAPVQWSSGPVQLPGLRDHHKPDETLRRAA
jgi:hypothetical protein